MTTKEPKRDCLVTDVPDPFTARCATPRAFFEFFTDLAIRFSRENDNSHMIYIQLSI
jgi:hypothetical protein